MLRNNSLGNIRMNHERNHFYTLYRVGTPTHGETLSVHRPTNDNSDRAIIFDMSDNTLILTTCYAIQSRTCLTGIGFALM